MKSQRSIQLLTSFILVIVLSSFQDSPRYNGELTFVVEALKNNSNTEQFVVNTRLTNTTDDSIIYIREACDESTSYYFDPCKGIKRIIQINSGITCWWNGAKRFQIPPHTSVVETVRIQVKRPERKFRLGFNYLPLKIFNADSLTRNALGEMVPGWEFAKVKNIIWSDTLEIK